MSSHAYHEDPVEQKSNLITEIEINVQNALLQGQILCRATSKIMHVSMNFYYSPSFLKCDMLWRNREQVARQMFLLLGVQYIA